MKTAKSTRSRWWLLPGVLFVLATASAVAARGSPAGQASAGVAEARILDTPTATNTPACGLAWNLVNTPNLGPGNNIFSGAAFTSSTDVWAVGSYYSSLAAANQTLVERWDGTTWNPVASPNAGTGNNRLTAVAALSPSDVWAVGNYTS